MKEYTVVGLRDPDSMELFVAGVFEGRLNAVDTEGTSGGMERYAQHVLAESPEDAEDMVS